MKKALITGITGQDGAYLAKFLIDKGYEVHGMRRRSSSFNTYRIDQMYEDTLIKEKCITHDAKNIFYADNNHPSVKGSELINNLIMDKIREIEQNK